MVVAAPDPYVTFEGSEQGTRVAVTTILASAVGGTGAFIFGGGQAEGDDRT